MDLSFPPEAESFRDRVKVFLTENLPANWKGTGALSLADAKAFANEWREILLRNGLIGVSWPKEYGGAGLSFLEQVILSEEFVKAGVPMGAPTDVFGFQMLGNTLIAHGTQYQKQYFLPRILSGEDRWCQGYSEPNSGSDLASLSTRAQLEGDEWVINGQKTWTSAAHLANWMFLLARTDPEVPKHKGISFLLVPLDQPGVEIRPIRMLSGESEFNEVFFTDARTDGINIVGEPGQGWNIAMTLLGFERGETAATLPVRFRVEFDRLVELARETGANKNPLIRERLAWCYCRLEVMRYMGLSALTAFVSKKQPGPEASISKLYWSEYHKVITELAIDILGPRALCLSGRPPSSSFQTDDTGALNSTASWGVTFLNARAGTIYAGTSEIQKNILAELVLGMPKG